MTLFKTLFPSAAPIFSPTSEDLNPAEKPIRAEIFSAERLEAHAAHLAAQLKTSADAPRRRNLTAAAVRT